MKRLSLIFALAMVLIVSYFFVWCGKEGKAMMDSDLRESGLAMYIADEYCDPIQTMGTAIIRYMLKNDSWYTKGLCNEIRGRSVPLEDVGCENCPSLLEVKDFVEEKFESVKILSDNQFAIGKHIYRFELEVYDTTRNSIRKSRSIELKEFGMLLDTDIYNDYGRGIVYYKSDSGQIFTNDVLLSDENVRGNLIVLTVRDITPEAVAKPTSIHKGTYLVLTGIKIIDEHESSSTPEVELYICGNNSSLYYNKETNLKFDGGFHIDAAGYDRKFPDVNKKDVWYTCDDIALCRLTDSYEQKIMYVEDDAYAERFAHDDNDGVYHDRLRKETNIQGCCLIPVSPYYTYPPYNDGIAYFLIFHNDPQNNDDIDKFSEISNIKESTVPSFGVLISGADHLKLKIRKVTYE